MSLSFLKKVVEDASWDDDRMKLLQTYDSGATFEWSDILGLVKAFAWDEGRQKC